MNKNIKWFFLFTLGLVAAAVYLVTHGAAALVTEVGPAAFPMLVLALILLAD